MVDGSPWTEVAMKGERVASDLGSAMTNETPNYEGFAILELRDPATGLPLLWKPVPGSISESTAVARYLFMDGTRVQLHVRAEKGFDPRG
jgi:hypothetical protein